VLKVLVGIEAERADNADNGSRTRLEPACHVTNIEENELAGALEDGADDLAAAVAELLQLKSHAAGKVWVFGFSFDCHTHASLASCRRLLRVGAGAVRGVPSRCAAGVNPVIPSDAGLGFTRYTIL